MLPPSAIIQKGGFSMTEHEKYQEHIRHKRVYGRFTVYVRTGRLAGLISALVAGTYVRSD